MTREIRSSTKWLAALLSGLAAFACVALAFQMWCRDRPAPLIPAERDAPRSAGPDLSADSPKDDLDLATELTLLQIGEIADSPKLDFLEPQRNVGIMHGIDVCGPWTVLDEKNPPSFLDCFDPLASTGVVPGALVSTCRPFRGAPVSTCVPDDERVVGNGLTWLSEHQQSDGGWSFDLRGGTCANRCDHSGTRTNSRIDATGLALLAFLGAGHTHTEGEYKERIAAAIRFLVASLANPMEPEIGAASGGMSSEAIGTLALCESYAKTHDKRLKIPAQQALLRLAQVERPASDANRTSGLRADAWQLMAFKSGHGAYLQMPARSWNELRNAFEATPNTVADGNSTAIDPSGDPLIAAQCFARLLLGHDCDDPTLKQGVPRIAAAGPVKADLEFDFFATQSLQHWQNLLQHYRNLSPDEGRVWNAWHGELRDWLLHTQETEGHQKGSWFIAGDRHANDGGRLYCTAMAVMVLEIYYRHLPIYGEAATEPFVSRLESVSH